MRIGRLMCKLANGFIPTAIGLAGVALVAYGTVKVIQTAKSDDRDLEPMKKKILTGSMKEKINGIYEMLHPYVSNVSKIFDGLELIGVKAFIYKAAYKYANKQLKLSHKSMYQVRRSLVSLHNQFVYDGQNKMAIKDRNSADIFFRAADMVNDKFGKYMAQVAAVCD